MDHSEAVEKQAPERYLLNEMAIEDREAFEEHFFDCPECAADLRAESALIAAVRLRGVRRQPQRWAVWSSSAAAAILAVVVGYQGVLISGFQQAGVHSPRVQQQAHVLHPPLQPLSASPNRSPGSEPVRPVIYGDLLTVNIDPVKDATGYALEVVDARGVSWAATKVTASLALSTVYFSMPGGKLPPGSYSLNIKPEGAGQPFSVSFVVQ